MTTAQSVASVSQKANPSSRLTPPPPKAIAHALGVSTLSIDWLAGDGSDRCYFRVRSPETAKSFVLMQLAGSDLENLRSGSYDWVDLSKILSDSGVLVPRPVAIIKEHGAILIDDYGDEMLETRALHSVNNGGINSVLPLYRECIKTLTKFIGIRPSGLPCWTRRSFDEARFVWELDFFVQKYLEGVCRRSLSNDEQMLFKRDSVALAKFLSGGSKYFVHRDFHSRNVMVSGSEIAIIDFQDARLGPISYDLVSLCYDSYVPFSMATRLELLEAGIRGFSSAYGASIGEECRIQWRPMLLQRQLKAIGSFGYLTVDKQKGDYLKNVLPAMQTLNKDLVFDSRWPFISGTLLEIMGTCLPPTFASGDRGAST